MQVIHINSSGTTIQGPMFDDGQIIQTGIMDNESIYVTINISFHQVRFLTDIWSLKNLRTSSISFSNLISSF